MVRLPVGIRQLLLRCSTSGVPAVACLLLASSERCHRASRRRSPLDQLSYGDLIAVDYRKEPGVLQRRPKWPHGCFRKTFGSLGQSGSSWRRNYCVAKRHVASCSWFSPERLDLHWL